MHLRRLVVKGFKSFADRTTIDFSPGISVIVGPNGSGKSNIVDAIAWVLGERGARALRGGQMADVIFAGTPQRQGLGRAEVELTIDNTDQHLPIEFTEVTLRRTLFRTGESEYAINGTPCRLLDIQELLSDSGIGRELHTLVGQGHLDDILEGGPNERRAVIEEAAGLLKHRKRKEKALRKLEGVDGDLARLGDVIGELKRAIRPLERQAEVAKRAEALTAELQELRLKLWVLDVRAVISEDDAETLAAAIRELEGSTSELAQLEARQHGLEADVELAQRDAESLLTLELKLRAMLDRFRSLATLAEERSRRFADRAARAPTDAGPDPQTIAEADAAAEEAKGARTRAAERHAAILIEREAARAVADAATQAAERVRAAEVELATQREQLEAASSERAGIEPLVHEHGAARAAAQRDIEEVRAALSGLEAREAELAGNLDVLEQRRQDARRAATQADAGARETERTHAALEARRAVLAEELARSGDATAALEGRPWMLGRLVDAIECEAGYEAAARAALGRLADAVLVTRDQDAAEALGVLAEAGTRGVVAVIATLPTPSPLKGSIAEHVRARSSDGVAIAAWLAGTLVVEDLAAAVAARATTDAPIVTLAGERIEAGVFEGGAIIAARDLRDEVRQLETALVSAARDRDAAIAALDEARGYVDQASAEVAVADEQLNALDAESEALHVRLDRALRAADAAEAELLRLETRKRDLDARIAAARTRLGELETVLAAEAPTPSAEPGDVKRLDEAVAGAAGLLGERTERERAAIAHAAALREHAARAAAERDAYTRGREAWERGAVRCARIATEARAVAGQLEGWVTDATDARTGGDARRATLASELSEVRQRRRSVEQTMTSARDRAHTAELRQADRRHRLETLEDACRERLGMEPSEALEAVDPSAADREEFEQQARSIERKLGLLGRVNPIAMEQYDELVERHRFLTEQVADLATSRRELLGVVTEVDRTITEIFGTAFNDIATEFERIFDRLFPGGEGRLSLVDPADLLETGIEIEARPAGKRVKRVSLLSGGERSLVALALLFAIFKARPSPFYLLDEVEAALDDVNLHRLHQVIKDFRDSAQLLIVTHQKRTMEIGDVIYGISMAEAGVSRVLSERLDRTPESV